jgi:hypothetical protein
MSDRSELRAERLEIDGHQCRWPSGWHEGRLEMAHLKQSSQGGPDTIANVVMLCRYHHDILDNRLVKGRRTEILALLQSYLGLETLLGHSWEVTDEQV